jgi:hypothetical protein
MSRARTERKRTASDRWPTLLDVASGRNDPEHAVDTLSIDRVGRLLEEWQDWNSGYSWKPDSEQYLFEVFELGDDPRAARAEMDRIYDKAVRRWRAAGHEFRL